MSQIAIKIENLSKRYRIGLKEENHDTFFGTLSSWVKYPLTNFKRVQKLSKFDEDLNSEDVIWALRDISFEVKKGEVLGIIGKNGAGKSTLLKILARITEPTTGRVEISGRIASLLEVGTGFHPELTGKENVYLNGTILGMSKKEIDRKFDEIVDFSGIEKFIYTPVKRFSSGMRVRLAFSVAAFLDPEILLIDEVLAVGDVEFQKKCIGKMGSIAGEGRTVLFVSHNMSAVSDLTERCIILHDSVILKEGATRDIVPLYIENSIMNNTGLIADKFEISENKLCSFSWIKIFNETETQTASINEFEPLIIEVAVNINMDITSLQVGCGVVRLDMNSELFTAPSEEFKEPFLPGLYTFRLRIEPNYLRYGFYGINLKLFANGLRQDTIRQAGGFTIIKKSTSVDSVVYQKWVNGPLLFNYKWHRLEFADSNNTGNSAK
ncbi:MAG: ABC transporter ATP-binding protein [Bacteroidetes bacterium]|nr:ABC transporter ATP-binding protein [Bacteroidota bacterium]